MVFRHKLAARALVLLLGYAMARPLSAAATDPAALGQTVKFKILIDNEMQRANGWVTDEWMVRDSANAGFNVYTGRYGGDHPERVSQVGDWAAKYGICHVPWLRATYEAPDTATGQKLLWANGVEQPLYSPSTDEFWQRLDQDVLNVVRASVAQPAVCGVFLDFVDYAQPGGNGNAYDLSYDDTALAAYAGVRSSIIATLPAVGRAQWLQQRGLHDRFADAQVRRWREQCRALRQTIDAINPKFRLYIYPGLVTRFLKEVVSDLGTGLAPLVICDNLTQGRPSPSTLQIDALNANRTKLRERVARVQATGASTQLVGGVATEGYGADPEFTGKNAVAAASVTYGYWAWLEGARAGSDSSKQYWRWFKWANEQIDASRLMAWQLRREDPESFKMPPLPPTWVAPKVWPAAHTPVVELPPVVFRGMLYCLLDCQAGEHVGLRFANRQTAPGCDDVLLYELLGPNQELIDGKYVLAGQIGRVEFIAPAGGTYLFRASAGDNGTVFEASSAPLAISTASPLTIWHGADKLYFKARPSLRQVSLNVRAANDSVAVTVADPRGQKVATAQVGGTAASADFTIPVGNDINRAWSLQVAAPATGAFGSSVLTFDPAQVSTVSLLAEHAYTPMP